MKITMVGTGYVGLVTGGCLATTGNTVICLDIDEKKIDLLRNGQTPIYEPGLSDMIARNVAAGVILLAIIARRTVTERSSSVLVLPHLFVGDVIASIGET